MSIKDDILLLKKLMFFVETTKNGQIKSTACSNGLKQSNLSKAISELEEGLQIKLLNRGGTGVSLTSNGKELFEIASTIQNVLYKVQTFKSTTHLTDGEIRLWCGDGLASGYISSKLPDFYREYPNISIDINCSMDSPQIIYESDIAIVYEEPKQNNAVIISKHVLKFGFFASKSYLTRHGYPKDENDFLKNHKICNKKHYMTAWKDWDQLIQDASDVCINTNSSNMLLQLVREGVGIGLLPMNLGYETHDLIHLSKINKEFSHPFWIVSHKDVKDVPKVRALIDYIQKI